jgi:hypothetical protein
MVQFEKFGRRNVVLISSNSPQSTPIFGNNYLKQLAVGALSGRGGASRLKASAWDETCGTMISRNYLARSAVDTRSFSFIILLRYALMP